MQVDHVIWGIVKHSPMTGEQASAALGKSRAYISVAGAGGRSPELATVASVADVCGVDVVLVDRATGERVGVVEPPGRAQGKGTGQG